MKCSEKFSFITIFSLSLLMLLD